MTTIRENARYGAVLGTVFWSVALTGCLSEDEQLFQPVAAPERAPAADESSRSLEASAPLPAERAESTADREGYPAQLILGDRALLPPASASPQAPAEQTGAEEAPPVVANPCVAGGLSLCDTFEAFTPGQFPSGGAWLAELPGCGSHVVDESGVSRSGLRALRADAGGYPECMLHADVSEQDEVYVRSWIRLGGEAQLLSEYFTVLELGPRSGQDEPELRIGLRPEGDSLCGGAPGVDVSVSGLAQGPATECTGVVLEQERYYCFQAHLSFEARRLTFSLQIDGQSTVEREFPGLAQAWSARELYFKVGRAAYGPSPVGSVFHDDVAVGSEPIPCEP